MTDPVASADQTPPESHIEPSDDSRRAATDTDAGGPNAGGPDQASHGRRPRDPWIVRAGVTVAVGIGVGVLAAVGVGLAGASGQWGAIVVLLIVSLAAALGALMALVSAVVDEVRGGDVGWRRPVMGIALFVVAAMLMSMTVVAAG